jgi:hypothetical protein
MIRGVFSLLRLIDNIVRIRWMKNKVYRMGYEPKREKSNSTGRVDHQNLVAQNS